jgi:hypothetical protein
VNEAKTIDEPSMGANRKIRPDHLMNRKICEGTWLKLLLKVSRLTAGSTKIN